MPKVARAFTPFFAFARHLGRPAAVRAAVAKCQSLPGLEDILTQVIDPQLLAPEAQGDHSRQRHFDFATTLLAFLWQAMHGQASCQQALMQIQAVRAEQGRPIIPSDTGPFCTARSNLPVRRLRALHTALSQALEAEVADAPGLAGAAFAGRNIYLLDGTNLSLEDTPKNAECYGYAPNIKPGCGFPMAGLSTLFNLRTGSWCGHQLSKYGVNELKRSVPLLRERLQPKDIVVGDRAFPSYWMLAWLQAQGADGLFRITESKRTNLRRGQRLGPGERLMTWQRPPREEACALSAEEYALLPAELSVRVLSLNLPARGQRTRRVVLATTLLDRADYPPPRLADLLAARWQVELRLAEIKTVLGLDPLRCKSPQMVERALWVYACAYNLVRLIMLQAAQAHDQPLGRLSFSAATHALQSWMSQHPAAGALGRNGSLSWWSRLLCVVAGELLPVRPGRHEPRVLKRRGKDFDYMTRPRKSHRPRPSASTTTNPSKSP